MRNGFYRLWVSGPQARESCAAILHDGVVFAVDRLYAFNGTYQEHAGRMTAEITCKRLFADELAVNLPDMDTFHITASGTASGEIAQLECTIDGLPGIVLSYELAFVCEV
jgi:hypothetical protein